MNTTLIVLIFCATYILIAARRVSLLPIGRPGGALLGATLMIAIGALTPEESYSAINHDTILLLFATMLLTVYLEDSGFFEKIARNVLFISKTPQDLLIVISVLAAFMSAFLVNDTACLFLTPVVVVLCQRGKLPLGPYLIALATSANIGSAATLVGNPQNMIIGSVSKIPFIEFIAYAGPAALCSLLVNIALLLWYYRKSLPKDFVITNTEIKEENPRFKRVLATVCLVILCFFMGFHLGYTALAGCLILIISERKDPRDSFARIDWSLLIFFCCLFIVTKALAKTGILEQSWAMLSPHMELSETKGVVFFSAFLAIGCQLVSNVPMVLLTIPYMEMLGSQAGWILLAFVTTIAGNFTLIGSVANIIVAERARDAYCLGFWEYLRFGFFSTITTLVVGVSVILLLTKF